MSSEAPQERGLVERGLAVVRAADELDLLEGRLIEARFTGEEAAEAYLYVIMPTAENRLPKPIVGPTVDFKRLIVALLNRTGETELAISDEPPIIQDITLPDGKVVVRVLTRAVDKKTGVTKWAVKEEARRGPHAATIALEKAEGKALESHPSYNRKLVNQKIKQFLRKMRLDPKDFIIGGGASAWGELFGRAKKAGIAPAEVRATVREAVGVGLSGVATAEEAGAAVAAVDDRIERGKTPVPRVLVSIEGLQPPEAVDMVRIRELTTTLNMTNQQKARLWEMAGGPKAVEDDFRRTQYALEIMAAEGVLAEEAARRAREAIP